jgi:hypothetical protein
MMRGVRPRVTNTFCGDENIRIALVECCELIGREDFARKKSSGTKRDTRSERE